MLSRRQDGRYDEHHRRSRGQPCQPRIAPWGTLGSYLQDMREVEEEEQQQQEEEEKEEKISQSASQVMYVRLFGLVGSVRQSRLV